MTRHGHAFRFLGILPLLLPGIFVVAALAALGGSGSAQAQPAPSDSCRVLLMVDRSASIGDNWSEMRTQIDGLFTAPELQSEAVSLGYWTFSNVSNPALLENYNKPYHQYVDVAGDPSGYASFMNTLPTNGDSFLDGQTNYEQAFGYNTFNDGVTRPNSAPPNSSEGVGSLSQMRDDADVLVMITDGLPNYPVGADGVVLDGNPTAVARGKAARGMYADRPVIGAYVYPRGGSAPDLSSLNETINGNPNDQSHIGPFEFGGIERFLTEEIANACNVQPISYQLNPAVNVDNVAVQAGDTINYSYSVNNDTSEGENGTSGWQLYDVTIRPTVAGNPLDFDGPRSACPSGGGRPYCTSIDNCTEILAMIGNQGTCDPVPAGGRGTCGATPSTSPGTGTNIFTPGINNTFYSPPRCQTIDDLPLGTRICSILSISKPTFSSSIANRISSAECVTIGKTPLVQIHGGDLRVGKYFNGDPIPSPRPNEGVYTSRFKTSGDAAVVPYGRTFGSWVEYGVLAPGPIERIASLSGYAGQYRGYDNQLATTSCDINVNKLTFANKVADTSHSTECGYLKDNSGSIPDVISALTNRTPLSPTSFVSPLRFDAGSAAGLYRLDGNSVNLEISTSTLAKGKTFIVYIPEGTVTISNNILAADDIYNNIGEIPQLVVIAKRINIRDNVTRVDAWLVANDSNAEGVIDTCSGVAPLSSAVCNQPLRINGPVMANRLDLWRTTVDLTGCTITVATDCQGVGNPAETMNLAGGSLLWARGFGDNPSRAQTTYTVELPPYY